MRCPSCGHTIVNPVSREGGRVGGKAKVAKGFAAPAVQAKAQATRAANRKEANARP